MTDDLTPPHWGSEDEQDAHLRRLRVPPLSYWLSKPLGQGYDPCDDVHPHRWAAPREPQGDAHVWYRDWEVGFSFESEYWAGEGWIAYKGGCDLDAREVRAATYAACLDAIDDEEDK